MPCMRTRRCTGALASEDEVGGESKNSGDEVEEEEEEEEEDVEAMIEYEGPCS